ncbi:alpha-tocopherol transfer protein-like isoform X1 [Haemaphysalis longicornis]
MASTPDTLSDDSGEASPDVSPSEQRALTTLRKLIEHDPSLNAKTETEFLLRFLRFSHMRPKKALQVLKSYYDAKRKEPELFRNFLPSELAHVFSRNLVGLLPDRDTKGRLVLVLRAGAWNPEQVTFVDAVRAILMCFEWAMMRKAAHTNGLCMLCDMDGWGYSNVLSVPASRLGGFARVFPGYPVKKRRVDIVKQPYSFNVFFKMITPFLDASSIAKVHFHGTNVKALHKRFPAKMLPSEFGGTQGPFDASSCLENLKSKEAVFAEDFEYGYLDD